MGQLLNLPLNLAVSCEIDNLIDSTVYSKWWIVQFIENVLSLVCVMWETTANTVSSYWLFL